MVRRLGPLLLLALGCQGPPMSVPRAVEVPSPDAVVQTGPGSFRQCPAQPELQLDLPHLWELTLANNPTLREAEADVGAAQGHMIQAGLYPNPHFHYVQETIGSSLARQGNLIFEVNQEIVTAGKRRLDRAVAERETSAAAVGLLTQRFQTLTRVRRAYYDFLGLLHVLEVNREVVATLERGVEVTRQQVERAKTRPQTDLLRLEALLAEARINQARTEDAFEGAWRQLAAEVGVPSLPHVAGLGKLPEIAPRWSSDDVLKRTLAVNSSLTQASLVVDRASLAVKRARAGAVPNVTVGAGYNADNTDQTAGYLVSVEAALPLWDRQQGAIREAQARLASAEAALRVTEYRLRREGAEAFARYKAASRQVERLAREVLPRLQSSEELLRKAYQAGSAQVTFSDLLTAEQSLSGTRLTLAEARRSMWLAIADLQGLMQLDVCEEHP